MVVPLTVEEPEKEVPLCVLGPSPIQGPQLKSDVLEASIPAIVNWLVPFILTVPIWMAVLPL